MPDAVRILVISGRIRGLRLLEGRVGRRVGKLVPLNEDVRWPGRHFALLLDHAFDVLDLFRGFDFLGWIFYGFG